jgi:hypothetical protein
VACSMKKILPVTCLADRGPGFLVDFPAVHYLAAA